MKKLHKQFHKDGSLWAKGYLVNGKEEGYWEWYRKDGTKLRTGNFKDGKQVGIWITYDSKGKEYKKSDILPDYFVKVSAPATRALQSLDIHNAKDLSKYTKSEIQKLHGIGPSAFPALQKALENEGLNFKKD